MTEFSAEIFGTMLLILLGGGVCANVNLKQTLGNNGGWLLINFGWGMAVYVAVLTVGDISGAHLNPAVTIGLAAAGKFAWAKVGSYILAQCIGAAIGAFLVWLMYRNHFAQTDDAGAKLGVFSTGPTIRNYVSNIISEIIGTFVLIAAVLYSVPASFTSAGGEEVIVGLGALGALPVALVVFAIGMSLGGTTGYAINPARDLMPRIMHAILPIPNKGDSDWSYAWVPVLGPILGALLASAVYILS